MKFSFILLMFMFVAIYIFADKYQFSGTHSNWLTVIIIVSAGLSIIYLFYMAQLIKLLGKNPIVWVFLTAICGPLGLLVSYIIISGNVVKIQRRSLNE